MIDLQSLFQVKYFLEFLPPWRTSRFAVFRAWHHTLLETVRHSPPFSDFDVLAHPLHVAFKVDSDVLEGGKEDAGCRIMVDAIILDITDFDLLQYFGPYRSVNLLVLVEELGL